MTFTPPPLPGRATPMFDIADGEKALEARINVVLYGDSGVGKTALATALPWGTPRWGDTAVYVAWDAGSESLLSVRPEDRKHLKVVTPRLMKAEGDRLVLNPYKAAMEIATADWGSIVPGCRTLIWDGGTRLAEQILRAVANTGATVSQAKKDEGTRLAMGTKGEPGYMALPIIPDYGMAQHSIMQWSEFLRQQPLNIIVVCVSDYYKPEGGSPETDTIGGPALVGTKIIPKFMAGWDNIFRISQEIDTVKIETPGQPPKFERIPKRILWTTKAGIWGAKIRRPSSTENPIARYEATTNWTDFWNIFDANKLGV